MLDCVGDPRPTSLAYDQGLSRAPRDVWRLTLGCNGPTGNEAINTTLTPKTCGPKRNGDVELAQLVGRACVSQPTAKGGPTVKMCKVTLLDGAMRSALPTQAGLCRETPRASPPLAGTVLATAMPAMTEPSTECSHGRRLALTTTA